MKHEFNRNEDWMKLAVSQMRSRFEQVCQGGGSTLR